MIYQVWRLGDPNTHNIAAMQDAVLGLADDSNLTCWGVFQGLFGLASNEVYWVGFSPQPVDAAGLLPAGVTLMEQRNLEATVRPLTDAPREAPGIYVFRWFDVDYANVDRIAALSNQAWNTFEADFDTQVQALFADADRRGEHGKMLLVTWYKDLTVWQQSRLPHPEARALFQERASLTTRAYPVATRLLVRS